MLGYPSFKHKNLVFVFANEGQKFSIRNQNIIVKDKENAIILQNSCYKSLSVWIIGHCSLSSVFMGCSKKYGFSVFLLSPNFRNIGAWNSKSEGNVLLRKKQYMQTNNLAMAQWLLHNKIHNQRALLKKERNKTTETQNAIDYLCAYMANIDTADNLQELLGIEGSASRAYFSAFFKEHQWKGRKPRVKHDVTNLLMDMGYTYLFNYIENLVHLYGFDVYKGFFHQEFYQRKSLICDLVEPFRPIIDRQIRKSYNLGQIHMEDFKLYQGQYQLDYKSAKPYTKFLLNSILDHKADLFYYIQQYYRCFMRDKAPQEFPIFDISHPWQKNRG